MIPFPPSFPIRTRNDLALQITWLSACASSASARIRMQIIGFTAFPYHLLDVYLSASRCQANNLASITFVGRISHCTRTCLPQTTAILSPLSIAILQTPRSTAMAKACIRCPTVMAMGATSSDHVTRIARSNSQTSSVRRRQTRAQWPT